MSRARATAFPYLAGMRRKAFLVVFMLAACGGEGPGGGPKKRARTAGDARHPDEIHGEAAAAVRKDFAPGDVVRGGQAILSSSVDVGTFNPYLSTSAYDFEIHSRIYPFALRENTDFQDGPATYEPAIVDRWSVEGKTIRMHIRADAVWSDGTPITAHDARFSWQAAANKDVAWTNTADVDHIADCEVVDDKTYVLHYAVRYPYMLKDARSWRILPKHVFGKIPFSEWKSYQDWDRAASVVSGPYRVASYRHNEEILFEPNEKYWDKSLPRLSKIYIRVLKDRQTVFEALLAGEVDMQASVEARNAKKVLEHPDLFLYTHASLIYEYVGWNCEYWLFREAAVRRALTMAINVDSLILSLLYGYGARLNGPILSTLWAHNPDLPHRPYDPEQAEAILAGLGWARGAGGFLFKDGKRFEFTLTCNSSNNRRIEAMQYIQADLKRIGVKVNLQQSDFNTMGENLRKGREQAWIGGWWLASKVDLKNIFHEDSIGGYNFGRWRHSEASALMEKARTEPDLAKARTLWHRIHAIMYEDQPYTWLYEMRAIHALRKRFQCVEINANETWFNLSEWFIPKSARGATR